MYPFPVESLLYYLSCAAEVNPLAGQEGQHAVRANTLTIDHKPEDPNEIARIETQGHLSILFILLCNVVAFSAIT